jgi:hypothetical protein
MSSSSARLSSLDCDWLRLRGDLNTAGLPDQGAGFGQRLLLGEEFVVQRFYGGGVGADHRAIRVEGDRGGQGERISG